MPTVTVLIAEVRDLLDEVIAVHWSDTQLRKWLNEANRDLARATRHLKDTVTIATVAGTYSYAVPSTVLAIELAWYRDVAGNRHIPLVARHLESMDDVRGYQWDLKGTPQFFATQGFSPNLTLVVHPTPTVTGDSLVLHVARLPTAIDITGAGDASNVDTPTAWYDALADYCEFKALRRDRDPRWQEAYKLYQEKRDALINNPDYLAVNRELVADPVAGYLPRWLVAFD